MFYIIDTTYFDTDPCMRFSLKSNFNRTPIAVTGFPVPRYKV